MLKISERIKRSVCCSMALLLMVGSTGCASRQGETASTAVRALSSSTASAAGNSSNASTASAAESSSNVSAASATASALGSGSATDSFQLTAGVLHAGDSGEWKYLEEFLQQSTVLNVTVQDIVLSDEMEKPSCDVLYLYDSSVDGQADANTDTAQTDETSASTQSAGTDTAAGIDDTTISVLENYVSDGGILVVPNSLYDDLPADLLGAKSFNKVEGCPTDLSFPHNRVSNLGEMQSVLSDFASLYPSFHDYETLSQQDYGYAMDPDTANVIARTGDGALYTVNDYGKGACFFTNPLLPNIYCQTNMAMAQQNQQVSAFSNTVQSAGRLFLDSILSYAAKQKYGYCLNRVYGYFGSPALSWEIHYEEITGIAHNSLQKMDQLCREYHQVPSFSLVRNTYTWFQKSESITYLLHGDDGYQMDEYEDAYASGTHIDADGQWLSQQSITNTGSYFEDNAQDNYRAYPCILDYDGNGTADIFSGSEDGTVRYYQGLGYQDRLKVAAAVTVTAGGEPLSVGSFSAPTLADIDGDGYEDLICGGMGGVLNWYRGNGTLDFEPQGQLLAPDVPGQVLPATGDVDGDGVTDLVVGSDQGTLMIYYGQKNKDGAIIFSYDHMKTLSRPCADAGLGTWIAPTVSDGKIYVGTFDGYVAVVDPEAETASIITENEQNWKGNTNIKFGNYAVPALYDLNGDGEKDLICGCLEYGLAYPIDSDYFPYRDELQSDLQYAKDNHIYVGCHFMSNTFESAEREANELEMQKKAFASYGLDMDDMMGANQHTWYTSPTTMESCRKAGLLWNSGFGSPGATWRSPTSAAETVMALPFFYTGGDEEESEFLVQNCSVVRYGTDDWYDISARSGMPVNIYYHSDFIYESDADAKKALKTAADFIWKYHYVNCAEDQEMKAVAAASHLQVKTSGNLEDGLTIEACPQDDFPLYDEDVAASLGIRITPADGVQLKKLATDADVWYKGDSGLNLALNRPVTVKSQSSQDQKLHLEKINMAAEVSTSDQDMTITFKDDGMMQAMVDGSAQTDSEGWDVEKRSGKTIFTKYGTGETLHIIAGK